MASEWIIWTKELPQKQKVLDIAADLEMDPFAVVGRLMTIWGLADDRSQGKNPGTLEPEEIDELVKWPGFATAMVKVGWLKIAGNGVQFPAFAKHHSQRAKTRALARERVRRWRERQGKTEKPDESKVKKKVAKKRKRKRTKADLWGTGKIQLQVSTRAWVGITAEDMAEWAESFPAVDIELELKEARSWCFANGAKGRKSNYRRFLVSWFKRSQDRGGTTGYGQRTSTTHGRGSGQSGAAHPRRKSAADRGEYREPDRELPFAD
jgi:hypothetical protein